MEKKWEGWFLSFWGLQRLRKCGWKQRWMPITEQQGFYKGRFSWRFYSTKEAQASFDRDWLVHDVNGRQKDIVMEARAQVEI